MPHFTCIILSGLAGSGKSTLAKELTVVYGWPVVSIGDTWRKMWAEQHPDKDISFEKFIESLTREQDRIMNEKMRDTYEKGGVIGDARYAVCYRDIPGVLLVYVTASLEVRVERAVGDPKYHGKSAEDVRRILQKREEHEVNVCKDLFGVDYRDVAYYHVALNSGLLPLQEEVKAIGAILPPANVRRLLPNVRYHMKYDSLSLDDPDLYPVVIEIEKGSNLKYEYDEQQDSFLLDFVFSPDVVFPYAYGFIPQTLGGDGDTLDAFVISSRKLTQGDVVQTRLIGYIDQWDRSEEDLKVIAVDVTDQASASIVDIIDLGDEFCQAIQGLYAKIALQKNKQIEIRGYAGVSDARDAVRTAHQAWKDAQKDVGILR